MDAKVLQQNMYQANFFDAKINSEARCIESVVLERLNSSLKILLKHPNYEYRSKNWQKKNARKKVRPKRPNPRRILDSFFTKTIWIYKRDLYTDFRLASYRLE